MNFYLKDILISKDEGVNLKIKKSDLSKCINFINSEQKTRKSKNLNLTVSVKFITSQNMKKLNSSYSGINKATNVLSFLPDLNETDENNNFVGDIALCSEVLKKEAKEQNKKIHDHLLHLFTHGVLHLLGYEHDSKRKAALMESVEKKILKKLGIDDPYQIEL